MVGKETNMKVGVFSSSLPPCAGYMVVRKKYKCPMKIPNRSSKMDAPIIMSMPRYAHGRKKAWEQP